jgi:PAS domain S-box-containing protein
MQRIKTHSGQNKSSRAPVPMARAQPHFVRAALPFAMLVPPIAMILRNDLANGSSGTGRLGHGLDVGIAILIGVGLIWQVRAVLFEHRLLEESATSNQALRQSEQHYRRIVESALEGIFQIDVHATLTFVNQKMADLLGYAAEEMLGHSALQFIAEQDRPLVISRIANRRLGIAEQYDVRCRHKNGELRWVRLSASPLVDINGLYSGSLALMADVTEQRAIEEARDRLAAIVESSDDAITSTDSAGTITSWNRGAASLYGYTAEEALGRRISILVPPEQSGEETALLAGMRQGNHLKHHETVRLCKDGRRIPVSLALAPILDADGAFAGGAAIARDITERKRTEEEQARKIRYAALRADVSNAVSEASSMQGMLQRCCGAVVEHLDAAFARIWLLDESDAILELQASSGLYTHIDGDHARVPVGKLKIGLIALEGRPHLTNNVLADPRVGDKDWALREGLVAFAGHPLIVAGKVCGVLAMFARQPLPDDMLEALTRIVDRVALGIERRRNAEVVRAKEEAEQANHAKSQFLSRMSHELRTPLNAVLGFAQVLEVAGLPASAQEYVERILRGGRHLLTLINDTLDISRIESGSMTMSVEPVPLAPLLYECLELIAPMAQSACISLDPGDLPICVDFVRADRQLLKQVFLNLLSNAVKYNRSAGRVSIEQAATEDGRIRIGVRDTGIGLDSSQLARLFRPFDRLGAECTNVEGTGLGLALSKGLLDRMGGSLAVESEAGVGSTFWVILAGATAVTDSSTAPAKPSRITVHEPGTRTVLYIEHGLQNVGPVRAALELYPYVRLETATEAAEGLEMARRILPDVIILHGDLPGMSGEEVLRRLHVELAVVRVPIIVIDGDPSTSRDAELRAAGATDYLTTPVQAKTLLRALDTVLLSKAS